MMATVLVVDDSSFMRNALKFIVEQAGHTVVGGAKDGEEAVEMYKKLSPDLVTMDILMPNAGGLDALAQIRQHDPSAKVIMVTALGQEEKQAEAQRLGAAGYIRKPFKQADVTNEINRVMGKAAA